jgi:predicted house-cleaning NTP pyrophosphatase (Maf/HAM1 superfamily)
MSAQVSLILGSSSSYRRRALQTFGFPRVEMLSPDIDEKAISHPDPVRLPLFVAAGKAKALLAQLRGSERTHATEAGERGEGVRLLVTADQVALAPPGKTPDGGAHTPTPREGSAATAEAPSTAEDAPPYPVELEWAVLPEFDVGSLELHEKPSTREEAANFIRGYSGESVCLASAIVVTDLSSGRQVGGVQINRVSFAAIPEEAVVRALEPMDVVSPAPGIPGGRADVFACCGAVCVEHPALAPFVRSLSVPMDEIFGLPANLVAALIRQLGHPLPAPLLARTRTS